MVNKFDEIRTRYSRAVQIWQILIGLARNRQTITYGMLGKKIGFKGVGIIGPFLDPIMRYCKQNKLPPLTIVVVSETTGSPGEGAVPTTFDKPTFTVDGVILCCLTNMPSAVART